VSNVSIDELGLPMRELQFEFLISTVVFRKILTTFICSEYLVMIEGHKFKFALICLPLQELDMILVIDWLFMNNILINYG